MSCSEAYKTSDTPLAAWLLSQGFKLQGVARPDPNSIRTFFTFDDSPELQQSIITFQSGVAAGNIMAYQNAYRYLVSLATQNGRQS